MSHRQRPPCCECGVTAPAYRCTICYSFYCSVACCKQHKSKVCSPPSTENSNSENNTHYQYPTEDTVDVEKLESLKENTELKQLLKDPLLRTMIKDINSHPNPGKALKFYMQQEHFCKFTDLIMELIEPQKNNHELQIQDLES